MGLRTKLSDAFELAGGLFEEKKATLESGGMRLNPAICEARAGLSRIYHATLGAILKPTQTSKVPDNDENEDLGGRSIGAVEVLAAGVVVFGEAVDKVKGGVKTIFGPGQPRSYNRQQDC